MGYTIIETLMKQLEADYTIEEINGTFVTFSFQKAAISGSASAHY